MLRIPTIQGLPRQSRSAIPWWVAWERLPPEEPLYTPVRYHTHSILNFAPLRALGRSLCRMNQRVRLAPGNMLYMMVEGCNRFIALLCINRESSVLEWMEVAVLHLCIVNLGILVVRRRVHASGPLYFDKRVYLSDPVRSQNITQPCMPTLHRATAVRINVTVSQRRRTLHLTMHPLSCRSTGPK